MHVCTLVLNNRLFPTFRELMGWMMRQAEWLGCPGGISKVNSKSKGASNVKIGHWNMRWASKVASKHIRRSGKI